MYMQVKQFTHSTQWKIKAVESFELFSSAYFSFGSSEAASQNVRIDNW